MKRSLDIIFSILALLLLSPLMLVICLVVLFDDGKPIIFKQSRVGKGNELFEIRKFRTMKKGTRTAAKSELSEANSCITRSGKFLRKTSLDELPQLFNILNGTMSFVGPRPLIPEEDAIRRLRAEYDVFSVLPGVTGLAQVSGRDNLPLEEKALLDREYVERMSVLFDLKILVKTVVVVLRRENISEGSEKKPEGTKPDNSPSEEPPLS